VLQFVLDVAEAKRLLEGQTVPAESDKHIQKAVLDKGCYKHETRAELESTDGLRTYVVEP